MSDSTVVQKKAEEPPEVCLHPLHLLDTFLAGSSVAAAADENDNHHANNKNSPQTTDKILRVADFLYGGSILEAALAVLDAEGIRKITCETSKRSLYLVRGATKGHYHHHAADYYLCLTQHSHHLYCSCRSYFERCKSDPKAALCKHLLALKLLPHLECQHCCVEETVPDTEYANIVLKSILPGE